ncbi:hypothetical protein [Nocardia blacklockiae]|uniref:hypothetical protein n=1 Tax=Nocardia blacklockiae TaxID=480036 RepID=UPI0018940932|nr:hypothetical protein [Nocardia blacklockiae]MBF6173746.1 hypothetical protein [Nocardia blacklockiae]
MWWKSRFEREQQRQRDEQARAREELERVRDRISRNEAKLLESMTQDQRAQYEKQLAADAEQDWYDRRRRRRRQASFSQYSSDSSTTNTGTSWFPLGRPTDSGGYTGPGGSSSGSNLWGDLDYRD